MEAPKAERVLVGYPDWIPNASQIMCNYQEAHSSVSSLHRHSIFIICCNHAAGITVGGQKHGMWPSMCARVGSWQAF